MDARQTIKLLKMLDAGVFSMELTASQNKRKVELEAELKEERERAKEKERELKLSRDRAPPSPVQQLTESVASLGGANQVATCSRASTAQIRVS